MKEKFYLLNTFLDFYILNKKFKIDILSLVNLIDSKFELTWNLELIEELVEESINSSDLENITLLLENEEFREIKYKSVDLSKIGLFLDSPVIYSNITFSGEYDTKMLTICLEDGKLNMVKYFIEKEVVLFSKLEEYDHISIASSRGKLNVVKYLIENLGYNPKSAQNFSIRIASHNGHLEVVKYLHQEAGCDPTDVGNWAIRLASLNGHLEVVKYLYEVANCDPTAGDRSAIKGSSHNGYLEVVKYLIEKTNCDPMHSPDVLNIASYFGRLEIVRYLVEEANYDPGAEDKYAIKVSELNGHTSVVQYFEERGYNI